MLSNRFFECYQMFVVFICYRIGVFVFLNVSDSLLAFYFYKIVFCFLMLSNVCLFLNIIRYFCC